MSYMRTPYYIYPSAAGVEFVTAGVTVPDDHIDAFLYKLLLVRHGDELPTRLRNGRRIARQTDANYIAWLEGKEREAPQWLRDMLAEARP